MHATSNQKITNPRKRQGSSSVEFALLFPLVLLFFTACVGLTQGFLLKDTAQHAAYEGVRTALVITSSADDVTTAVNEFTSSMGIDGAVVTVEPSELTQTTAEVSVTVSIPLSENAWIKLPFLPEALFCESTVTLARRQDDE
ncbi:MAG: TadE/TadG family type IV pilus assembly protein [Planctomycetota bacterium]